MKIIYFLLMLLVLSVVSAETYIIKTSSDDLEINESIGDVINALDGTKLGFLSSGSITTKKSTTKYNQYLRFKDTQDALGSLRVVLDENNGGDYGDFLFIEESRNVTGAVFEYELEFENGLESEIKSSELADLTNDQLNILGDSYVILKSTGDSKSVDFRLASYQFQNTMDQGEKKVYKIGSSNYDLEVYAVDSSSASLKINNKTYSSIKEGDVVTLQDGLVVAVSRILQSGSEQNNSVTIMMNATLMEFKDTDYTDSSFIQGFKHNKKQISDGWVKIEATYDTDKIKISKIKYRMTPSLKSAGDIYIGSGKSLSNYLKEPVSMLTSLWDIKYNGLSSQGNSRIEINPKSTDRYDLTFSNRNSKTYKMPFLSNIGGNFKLGDETGNLYFIEPASVSSFPISAGDYFVLTSSNDKIGYTDIIKYGSIDVTNLQIDFENLNSGGFSLPIVSSSVSNTVGEATITASGKSYKVYIKNDTSGYSISVDLNGDGVVGSDESNIITNGGGIIDLGNTNTPSSNFDITLTTPSSQFDEGASDEIITISMEKRTNAVGISGILGITTENQGSHTLGTSVYGVSIDLLDDGSIETLTVDYPVSQVFALVEVISESKGIITPTCSDGIQNQGEEKIDCGGPCTACEKPQNITENITEETNTTLNQTTCEGCEKDGNCYSGGTRINDLYCAQDGVIRFQKLKGKPCLFNYECMSTICEEGICRAEKGDVDYKLIILNIAALVGIIVFLILTMHSSRKNKEQDL